MKIALLSLAAGVASSIVDDTAARVAIVATGVAGALYLCRVLAHGVAYLWREVVKPFARLIRRALAAYEILEDLAEHVPALERIPKIEERLTELEEKAAATLEPVQGLARDLGVEHRGGGDRRTDYSA